MLLMVTEHSFSKSKSSTALSDDESAALFGDAAYRSTVSRYGQDRPRAGSLASLITGALVTAAHDEST